MSLTRQQFTLLGIFALFLGPVLLVILMRSSWWQYQPGGLKNHGQLVQPPVNLPLDLKQNTDKKWLILYVLELPCEQQCIDNLTALRQIHRAAGRHGEQLAIVLLSQTQVERDLRSRLESIYPKFNFITDSSYSALTTLARVNTELVTDREGPDNIHTYILDPMLNVILAYRADANPSDLHRDLTRLLKWSDQENRQ
jgi:hypothetical protein